MDAKNSKERIFNNKDIQINKRLEQVSGESILQTIKGEMLIDSKGKLTLQSKNSIDFGD